jgi:RHS repeat-associated protein
VLVQRGVTQYTQDLAAPLSQVLAADGATFVYGHERLSRTDGLSQTWYLHDMHGSLRMALDDTGAVGGHVSYDPWGVPDGPLFSPFGYTGELTDNGLVYLRARWYHPNTGTFTTRDPWQGDPAQPQSLHPYAYTHNNPVNATDPTGRVAQRPVDIALMNGVSFTVGLGGAITGGVEEVFNLWDFDYGLFRYGGNAVSLSSGDLLNLFGKKVLTPGVDLAAYRGIVWGWSNFDNKRGVLNYEGPFFAVSGGVAVPRVPFVAVGGQYFEGEDRLLQGVAMSVGVGVSRLPFGGSMAVTNYVRIFAPISFKRGSCPTVAEGWLFAAFIQLRNPGSIGLQFGLLAVANAQAWQNDAAP